MTNSNPNAGARLPNDALLSHAGGLRALAYDLLGDAHAADDVLQDTFVRALVSPPPRQQSAAGVRAWLRTVVRGVALNRRRNEAHRTERETRYVREREVQENDERGELLRAVVDAVLALDEPYRGVVLARYFEGLSTAEIAARTQTPLATVASRLQRAHGELRKRLEGDVGPRRGLTHALWLLAGAPASSVPAPSGPVADAARHAAPRAPLASTQALVAATLVVAAGVLAFVWHGASADSANVDVSRVTPTAGAAAAANTGALEAGVGSTPTRANGVATSSAPAAEAAGSAGVRGAGPHVYELEVRVRGDDGAPSVGTTLYGAPHGQPLVRLGVTGFDGQLALTWRAFEPELAFVVSTDARRHELVRAQLHAGVPEHVALVRPDARAWFMRPDVIRARVVEEVQELPRGNALSSANSSFEVGSVTSTPEFAHDEFGNGVFVDPFLTPNPPRADVPILSELPVVVQMFRAKDSRESSLVVRGGSLRPVTSPRTRESSAAVAERSELGGVVRDAAGRPVAAAALVVRLAAGGSVDIVADEHGTFTRGDLPRGAALVSASMAANGIPGDYAEVRVVLDAPHVDTELVLAPRNALRVHLVDERGEPLAEWRVEAEPIADPRAAGAAAVTDADGRAVLAPRGSGPFRMLARHTGGASVPAQLVADNVWPQSAELELAVSGGHTSASVVVAFRSQTGRTLDDGEVRLWRVDSGRGVVLPRANGAQVALPDGSFVPNFTLAGLAPGRYTLEGGAPGEPWSELMTIGVGADAQMALEVVARETRAELEIRLTDAQQRERVSGVIEIVRNGVLVRSPEFASDLPAVLAIPEGAGTLVWTRTVLREEVVERSRVALTSETFGEVVDGAAIETPVVTARSIATPGTSERHVVTGRPGVRTQLELAPLR